MGFLWLIISGMHKPRILDQMITSVYALHRGRRRKTIKEATARIYPLDLLLLTNHLQSLKKPIPFNVVSGKMEEDFTLTFVFDNIDWTCIPDVNVPEGAPLIILQTS